MDKKLILKLKAVSKEASMTAMWAANQAANFENAANEIKQASKKINRLINELKLANEGALEAENQKMATDEIAEAWDQKRPSSSSRGYIRWGAALQAQTRNAGRCSALAIKIAELEIELKKAIARESKLTEKWWDLVKSNNGLKM